MFTITPPGKANVAAAAVPLRAIPISSSPAVPLKRVVSWPSPPSNVTWAEPVTPAVAVSVSSPPSAGHVDVVGCDLAAGHARLRGEPADDERAVRVAQLELVGRRRAVHDDGVGSGVAVAVEAAQVDVDGLRVGAGEVVDGDGVGAAERAEADVLDAVEVHRRSPRRRG